MSEYVIGQRWISYTESNLGLGIITEVEHRRITIYFPAADEQRVYATANSPLGRVIYKVNDTIVDKQGCQYQLSKVEQRSGLMFYTYRDSDNEEGIIAEIELNPFVYFNSPKDRLLAGQLDSFKLFNLRQETKQHLRCYQQSHMEGLLGPRIQLLAHQLYVAHQAAQRNSPRVLLADEVGLGKTIEAGLIIHQRLHMGLAQRILILVPDSLLHQWLIEMRRRFNLAFSIINELMCQQDVDSEQRNPFEETQLVLAPLSFLVDNELRQQQALTCDWDLLVIDEAHHLEWSEQQASVQYQCVEALSQRAKGLLLLTATPEQLGFEAHFARLRLLDSSRYYDLQEFKDEEQGYQAVNDIALSVLLARETLSDLPVGLDQYIGSTELNPLLAQHASGDVEPACDSILNALLDRHGTGRVLFRNTRAAISGFPQRQVAPYSLQLNDDFEVLQLDVAWYPEDRFGERWLSDDPRVNWLLQWLQQHADKQVLLICAQARTATELENYLSLRHGIRCAVFHEEMSLLERDRAAAYFADEEQAAQILVCSEIGSEGRNFQFVNDLILFDLPLNPDLLEQRIGRLDRIGQKNSINIHVPYLHGSEQHVLYEWYHRGLDAFEKTCAVGQAVFDRFSEQLISCIESKAFDQLQVLIDSTKDYYQQLRTKLEQGRNRLLELNSCRQPDAEQLVHNVVDAERRVQLESYLERLTDQLGIVIEAHSINTIIMRPTENMRCGLLPGLKEEGTTGTFSRSMALQRDDIDFLSWEHPTVKSAMEYILDGHDGNASVATLKLPGLKGGALLMECFFNIEYIAPKRLRMHRYLPTTIIRVLVNIDGKNLESMLSFEQLNNIIKPISASKARVIISKINNEINTLMEFATQHAQRQFDQVITSSQEDMMKRQNERLLRMKALAKINKNIRAEELVLLEQEGEDLLQYLAKVELKADALRLIISV